MANVNTVKLNHIDIWAEDIESSRKFYTRFFAGKAKRKSKVNLDQSDSYSIKFGNGPALELKPKNKIADLPQGASIVHPTNNLSFKFENKSQVDDLTQWILDEGYKLESNPTYLENGFYSSTVYDPDQNRVQIFHKI